MIWFDQSRWVFLLERRTFQGCQFFSEAAWSTGDKDRGWWRIWWNQVWVVLQWFLLQCDFNFRWTGLFTQDQDLDRFYCFKIVYLLTVWLKRYWGPVLHLRNSKGQVFITEWNTRQVGYWIDWVDPVLSVTLNRGLTLKKACRVSFASDFCLKTKRCLSTNHNIGNSYLLLFKSEILNYYILLCLTTHFILSNFNQPHENELIQNKSS